MIQSAQLELIEASYCHNNSSLLGFVVIRVVLRIIVLVLKTKNQEEQHQVK
jgi:hypothetical protein